MKVSATIGLIDDFSLYGTSINLRIFIVNIVSKLLEVLSGVGFELWVSEHVANFFEMIGRFKSNKSSLFLFITPCSFNFFFIVPLAKIDSCSGPGRATATLLAQIWKVSWDNEAQIFEAVPYVKLGWLFLSSLMLFDFAELRANNLDKDFIFFKETRLKLKHWSYSLGDWIYSTLLVSQNVIIVFVNRFHQTDVLDIILQWGDWFHNKWNWEDMACPQHSIGWNFSINDSFFASLEERFKEIVMLYSNNRRH